MPQSGVFPFDSDHVSLAHNLVPLGNKFRLCIAGELQRQVLEEPQELAGRQPKTYSQVQGKNQIEM
jgi:hypothetical protein